MPSSSNCPKCKGLKHVRGNHGWKRCDCVMDELRNSFIRPKLRRGRQRPIQIDFTLFPLRDFSIHSNYDFFCDRAWMSLLSISHNCDLHYDFVEASRLVEIYLTQDSEYTRIRELEDLDLLILTLGVAEPPNKMLPSLVVQVVSQRTNLGKPTWIYSAVPLNSISSRYGDELACLLQALSLEQSINPSIPVSTKTLNPSDL